MKKSRKKEPAKPAPNSQEDPKPHRIRNSKSGAINTINSNAESTPATTKKPNDKNIETKNVEIDAVMVEKKKTYEFIGKDANQQEISLSDEFLGSKIKVKKITIKANLFHIYNFACQYDHQGASV